MRSIRERESYARSSSAHHTALCPSIESSAVVSPQFERGLFSYVSRRIPGTGDVLTVARGPSIGHVNTGSIAGEARQRLQSPAHRSLLPEPARPGNDQHVSPAHAHLERTQPVAQ